MNIIIHRQINDLLLNNYLQRQLNNQLLQEGANQQLSYTTNIINQFNHLYKRLLQLLNQLKNLFHQLLRDQQRLWKNRHIYYHKIMKN